jgi:hypothetical protein
MTEIERRARAMWDEREKRFPRFVRNTWEQGTVFAREQALLDAAAALENEAEATNMDRAQSAACKD